MNFAAMIHPVDPDRFLAEHWQSRPLLVQRGDPDYYARVLRLEDLESVFRLGRPVRSDVLLVNRHQRFSPTAPETAPDREEAVLREVLRAGAEGYTVNLKNVQRYWPGVADLCARLEDRLSHAAFAEAFLTPAGTQGFLAHWDNTDGFILHLAGRKRWRLYGMPEPAPLRNESFAPEALGEPSLEVVLEPGDFLYLPRGLIHEAAGSEGESLHLAVGLQIAMWRDLAAALLAAVAEEDPRWRGALPPGYLQPGREAEVQETLASLVAGLAGRVDGAAALEALREAAAESRRPCPGGRFADLDRLAEVGPDTLVEKRPGMVCRLRTRGDKATLAFPGNVVQAPAHAEPALRFVAETSGPFPARALPEDLSLPARQVLVRTLLREGLLTLA